MNFNLGNPIIWNLQASKTKENSLQHSARASGKIWIGAAGGLCQHAKWRNFICVYSFLEKSQKLFAGCRALHAMLQAQKIPWQDLVATFVVRNRLRSFSICDRSAIRSKGKDNKVYIRLLNFLAIVGAFSFVVPSGNLRIGIFDATCSQSGSGAKAQFLRSLGRISKYRNGHAIGKGIVVNILLPFICSDHIVNFILARTFAFHAACPKISNFFQHGISSIAQPYLCLLLLDNISKMPIQHIL